MNSEVIMAIHSLVYLANHPQHKVNSEELAKNICTNPARIRKIMSKLKKFGLLRTKEGSEGGCELNLPPEKITLALVLQAVNIPLLHSSWRSGSGELNCLIASGMAGVIDELTAELNKVCQQRLAQITIQDISRKIFKEKLG